MYCPKCGFGNEENAVACTNCNTQLGEPSEPAVIVQGNWWDGQARAYSNWMLWVHLLICSCPGLIVGLLFLACCTTDAGKNKGKQLLMYSGIGVLIGIFIRIVVFAVSQSIS